MMQSGTVRHNGMTMGTARPTGSDADASMMHPNGYPYGMPTSHVVRYELNMRRVIGAALIPVVGLVAVSVFPRTSAFAKDTSEIVATSLEPEVVILSSQSHEESSGITKEDVPVVTSPASTYVAHPEQWDYLCFDQGDEPWASQLYQTDNIASTGCGLCSAAHCLSMVLGEEITPDVLAQQMRDYSDAHGYIDFGSNGTVWAGWEEVLHGLYDDRVIIDRAPTTPEAVKDAVTHGRAVVFNAPSGGDVLNADGVWGVTPWGHVLSCYRYEDGYFYVKDSSSQQSGHGLGNAIRYSDADFAMMMDQASGHLGYVFTFEAKPLAA